MNRPRLESLETIIFRLLVDRQILFSLVIALIMLFASLISGNTFILNQERANMLLAKRAGDYFDSASLVIHALADMQPDQGTLDSIRSAYSIFDVFYLIDSQGKLQMVSPQGPQSPVGMDMSNQPFFLPTSSSLIVSRPFISPRTGKPTVYLSQPVAGTTSVIAGELNLSGLQDIIMNAGLDPSMNTYLIDSSGDLLSHRDYARVMRKENLLYLGLVDHFQAGRTRLSYFADHAWMVGVISEIPQTRWLVVGETPMIIAYSHYLVPAILGLIIASVLFMAVVWNEKKIIADTVVDPLNAVSYAAERLARGDYATPPLTGLDAAFQEIASLAASFEGMKQAVVAREAALLESEERWQFALDGPGDGVWDWNIAENREIFSRQYKAMLGYADDEFGEGHSQWEDRLHPEDRERVLATLNAHLSQNTPVYVCEFRMKNKDGEYVWVLSRGKVILWDNSHKPLRMIGTHVDIQRQKQIQRDLDDAIQQLEEKNTQLQELIASKDKLFSIIAHDLRGPLSSFIAFGQLFETIEEMEPEAYRQLLDEYNHSAQRIMTLLDNLLTWARSQRGKIEYRPENFLLSRTAQRNIELLSQYASQKRVTLRNLISPILSVSADTYMVDRVVNNLLSNALKFSHPGGCVEITARPVDDMVEVSITDNGIGMPEEIFANLFQVGVKTRQVGTAGEQGTGLGLILCKEFVEANGGVITAESQVEKGTTFRFTLPGV